MRKSIPYIPLTKIEQQDKANRISQKICTDCSNDYETGCKKCIWYYLFNEMIGEGDFDKRKPISNSNYYK